MSAAAGVICLAKPGERVECGQPLLQLRGDEPDRFGRAREALAGAIEIADAPLVLGPRVLERIGL